MGERTGWKRRRWTRERTNRAREMYIGCFDYDLDARCVQRNFYGWYMNKVSFLFKLWKTWTTTKNHYSHHKSFPERHELLQFSPRASQISSLSHCCDLKTHKEGWCLRRCTRYPVYFFSDWDEFASFEKEKVRDRRFPLPTFAFSPHSQPSQSYERNVNTLCVFT